MDTAGRRGARGVATVPPSAGGNIGVLVIVVLDEEVGIAAAIKTLRAFHEQAALTL